MRVLDTAPARGAWNMAVDEVLMESARAGEAPTLRFYRWAPACLSFGRNQPVVGRFRAALIERRGFDVVRRPTGGRAVIHAHELTYSVVMSTRALGSPRASYAAVNRALVAGLQRLGVAATLAARTDRHAPPSSLAPCFHRPAEGEVVVAGRKLVGSAQYRRDGVLLQHGSLLLSGDQREIGMFLVEPTDDHDAPATLAQQLDPLPRWETLVAALTAGFEAVTGARAVHGRLSAAETARARDVARHYEDLAWTWRS